MHGLRDLRVIDFSGGIAGGYTTKLFADAGADVVKVEGPAGDPLRRWSASGAEPGNRDGALFRFLHHGKRSVVGAPGEAEVEALVAGADLVVEGPEPDAAGEVPRWSERHPGLVCLSISPFGRSGPYRDRPASEFTIQAESGSIGTRGLPGAEPFQAGGRITEWVGGTFAAVAALAALHRARHSGHGERVDFSLLEVMNFAATNYMDLFFGLAGRPPLAGSAQSVETPSIEPTRDGYVGFCTNSAQQFSDFLLLIERPELREDRELAQVAVRMARVAEWSESVHRFTRAHSTREIVERASLLRIPVAPVLDGESVQQHEQLAARGVFQADPEGDFLQPRPPWAIAGERPPAPRPAPGLGADTGRIEPRTPKRPAPAAGAPALPLAGLRILDITNWWAGPSATHMLATLGADVVHIESAKRPDGMRMTGGIFRGAHERWWEWSFFFLGTNANKRGITLDLTRPEGVDLTRQLVAGCDVVVENFTPRVLDGFGLDWPAIHAANPQAIFVRMPAFGLDGPWRDHPGFAQTMEQVSGLAWVTGHAADQPRIQRGPCDPLAGMHAAFALLVALAERTRRNEGVQVECAMVEGALNAASEQILEWSAYGRRLEREGNRSPWAAPQGLYPTRGHSADTPRWLALSVENDRQWQALVAALGAPDWTRDPDLASHAGRRAAHGAIDARLRPLFADGDLDAWLDTLLAAGVPAAAVADPRDSHRHPQLAARGYHEWIDHPEVGGQWTPTVPFRYASVERWLRRPAPLLGEHNQEILADWLGLTPDAIAALADTGVIGDTPEGV